MLKDALTEAISDLLLKFNIPEYLSYGAKGLGVTAGCVLVGYFFPQLRAPAGAVLLATGTFFWGYVLGLGADNH